MTKLPRFIFLMSSCLSFPPPPVFFIFWTTSFELSINNPSHLASGVALCGLVRLVWLHRVTAGSSALQLLWGLPPVRWCVEEGRGVAEEEEEESRGALAWCYCEVLAWCCCCEALTANTELLVPECYIAKLNWGRLRLHGAARGRFDLRLFIMVVFLHQESPCNPCCPVIRKRR